MGATLNKKQNHCLRTNSSRSHRGWGTNCIPLAPNLRPAMHHHRETILSIHYDETKKMAHNSQIVRAQEYLKLSHVGPSQKHFYTGILDNSFLVFFVLFLKYQAPTMVACLCHFVISFFRLFAWRYGAAPKRNNAKRKDEITKKRQAK